jgi:predicted HTH domain antitoxin
MLSSSVGILHGNLALAAFRSHHVRITVELPNDLEQHPDPAREALEAVAIAGYRSGGLTAYQAGRLLGFTSRFEFEIFLKNRGVSDHAYGTQELAEDLDSLNKLRVMSGVENPR